MIMFTIWVSSQQVFKKKTKSIQSLTGLRTALQTDLQQRKLTTQNRGKMLKHETLYQGRAIQLAVSQL